MRNLKSLLLLSALLVFTGCFDSKYEACPSLIDIRYSLKDENGEETLISKIHRLDLFVYDSEGKLYLRRAVTKSDLQKLKGAQFSLPPGKYSFVTWANATPERSAFVIDPESNYLDPTKTYLQNAIAVGGRVTDGDPLYFGPRQSATRAGSGPMTITVPEIGGGKIDVEALLRHAHVQLEVTVEGYSDPSHQLADPLNIEIVNLTSNYDFAMNPFGNLVSYIQPATNLDPTKGDYRATFHVPVFDYQTPTQIKVTNSAGQQIVTPINLKDLVAGLPSLDIKIRIPIVITVSEGHNVQVVIDLPEWKETIVTPIQ